MMIAALVNSAFETGYLSVESEGLLRQVLSLKSCRETDLQAVTRLYTALQLGQIRREASAKMELPSLENQVLAKIS
jgi:hypothetical protein